MAKANRVSSAIAALRIGAGAKPSTEPVRAAYAELADLARHPPRPIPLDPHRVNLEDGADCVHDVFNALLAYLTAILDDPAQNTPDALDPIGGALEYAAVNRMAWRAA